MKKAVLHFIILFLVSFVVFADGSDSEVFKTTKELTAYKEYVSPSTQQESVTISIYTDSQHSNAVSDGSNIEITTVNTQKEAFYWVLTGNVFGNVSVSFTFGPMYRGEMSRFGSLTTTEVDRVIPYTFQLAHTRTDVGNATNVGVNTSVTASNNNNGYHETREITVSNNKYTLYIKYADKTTLAGNDSTVTLAPAEASITYNLSANTSMRYKTSNYSNSYTEYNATLSSYPTWVRSGVVKVKLNLNNNGTWTNNNTTITPVGGEYHAFVIVTITTGN